jgi:hypothetical protein
MEINTNTTTVYSVPTNGDPSNYAGAQTISIWQLPKLAWACAILFTINLLIAACIKISPRLQVDIYGRAAGDVVLADAKPSAFVEPEKRARPVRQAMKLKPVIEINPEVGAAMEVELANMPASTASLTVHPAVYSQPTYASGSQAIEAAEKQMEFHRISATLPRKATETAVRSTIVN